MATGAAAQFCTKKGRGFVERPFDEAIDINLYNPSYIKKFDENEAVCGY